MWVGSTAADSTNQESKVFQKIASVLKGLSFFSLFPQQYRKTAIYIALTLY
jgi:hypothetical protein